MLLLDKVNKQSLEDVERSIAVLCLDSAVGLWECPNKNARQNLAAAQTIHGSGSGCNGGNRWFDKTVQVRCVKLYILLLDLSQSPYL